MNVGLLPILSMLVIWSRAAGWALAMPNVHALLRAVLFINVVLLMFNLLPIYPLDGGQIVRSLLWFVVGRARSLLVATLIGFVGVAGLVVLAFRIRSVWFGVLSVFILLNCWGGLKQSVMLLRLAKLPRRDGFACPWCKAAPPIGNFWTCGECRQMFDIFELQAVCPHCAARLAGAQCLDCGRPHPMSDWMVPALVPQLKLPLLD